MNDTVTLEDYLDNDKSAFHAVSYCEKVLVDNGFKELSLKENYKLSSGEKYYIKPYASALFAFVIPEKLEKINVAMAHTDFPTFKIKPVAKLGDRANCNLVNVEPYGGSLKKTWFDRPLGVAGVVIVKSEDTFNPKEVLFDSEEAWLTIPSLAPHMDREIEKRDIDPAKEMNPVLAMLTTGDNHSLIKMIADKLNCAEEDILSYDLNLYDVTPAMYIGANKEFIQSGKLDNMASVAALTNAIIKVNNAKSNLMSIVALFDNEEIGSRTKQGADSNIIKWIITKICMGIDESIKESEIISILYNGMLLSCDGAHAVHPNYPEKADTTTIAEIGKGITIKTSASQRYVTDAKAIAIIKTLCSDNNIPFQMQANKSGTPGGQTLGPIVSSYLPMLAVDLGVPMLAMHSIRELAAMSDYEALEKLIIAFLNADSYIR